MKNRDDWRRSGVRLSCHHRTADGGDYTVHFIVGLDPEGRMYLLDRWRKQSSSDEWIEAFCDLVLEWKPVGWAEEKGQISAGVGPALDKRQERGRPIAIASSSRRGETRQ
jgi:hypothetical protein